MNRTLNKWKWDLRRFFGRIVCLFKGHQEDWGFSCKQPAVVKYCPRCMKICLVKDLSK